MKTDYGREAQNGHTGRELSGNRSKKLAQRINNPMRPRLLTIKKAAEYLGITEWGMRTLIWKGLVPSIRYPDGRKIFVDVTDLDSYVEHNKVIYN